MSLRILIMAGGTGGHVFPALAVARQLREQGVAVTWLGTRRGLEARVVPDNAFAIEYINVSGLRGKGLLGWLFAPFRLVYALGQAIGVLRRIRPAAVLGMGGFVTGPGGLASWLLRVPLLVHEQNAIAGLTNRLLSRLASCLMQAFPNTFAAARRAEVTGNPVRADIAALPAPAERFAARRGARMQLLVIGGSLGALALNRIIPEAMARIPAAQRPVVWHQCGRQHLELTQQAYAATTVEARVEPFIDDMAAAYAWADLVICRAGALTIAELAAAGVGSILVPFPHAVDDHQTANGRFLEQAGAAQIVQQADLDAQQLAATVQSLAADREHLLQMAEAARARAMIHATERVAQRCMQAMQGQL